MRISRKREKGREGETGRERQRSREVQSQEIKSENDPREEVQSADPSPPSCECFFYSSFLKITRSEKRVSCVDFRMQRVAIVVLSKQSVEQGTEPTDE